MIKNKEYLSILILASVIHNPYISTSHIICIVKNMVVICFFHFYKFYE